MLKHALHRIILIVVLLLCTSTHARTLVLVHGYLGDGHSWHRTGFTQPLIKSGWQDGGTFYYQSRQGLIPPNNIYQPGDVFFSVELPSKRNLQTQLFFLNQYLQTLYLVRNEPVVLVGHSAGGVLARLYLLQTNRIPVSGLISIASPHLGTPIANMALLASNSPLGVIASMAGAGDFRQSRGLYHDLRSETRGNFLYAMNRQSHPQNIYYASLIRRESPYKQKNRDHVVPAISQNMNNVQAIRGLSDVFFSNADHFIQAHDGIIVRDILQMLQQRKNTRHASGGINN